MLQRQISRPVLALTETARRISLGRDFSVRAKRTTDDELGQLTDAFNQMLFEIGEQTKAITALNLELESRVRDRTAELEATAAELESFSYSVSHDLRAPLRHVQGYVELLKADASEKLDGRALRYLNTIASSAQDMGQLIDALLSFSRIGRVELRRKRVSLDLLMSDVLRVAQTEAAGRDVRWEVGPLPDVSGDPTVLKQVFVNLVDNALKYSRARQPARIEIGSRHADDGHAIVYVRDNGAGFDMRYAEKLFGVFQRLHRAEDFEGTGIGLATVQRIVVRHGGRIWAESEPEKGATFYVTLPLYEETEESRERREHGDVEQNSARG
jgi:light-regulated signal transduction histidine kinase (bacteriophytochrome)